MDTSSKLLTCLICGKDGFLNLAGHIYNKHEMNGEDYRSKTGYEGPLTVSEHASRIARMHKWSEESRERLSESISASYTDDLKCIRSQDANEQWDNPEVRAKMIASMNLSLSDPKVLENRKKALVEHPRSLSNPMSILKKELRERANNSCEWCGKTEEQELDTRGRTLALHHKNYDRIIPDLEDVVLVCSACHASYHKSGKKKEGVERFPMVARAVGELLKSLGVDLVDPNFRETPRRVATFLLEKFASGSEFELAVEGFRETVFPSDYLGMIVSESSTAYGLCPHHLLPVSYVIDLAYIPKHNVCGLSKLSRMAELFASQAMLQEDVTEAIADTMEFCLQTQHVAVIIRGRHSCMQIRGVEDPNVVTTTSSMRGHFLTDEGHCKTEFFSILSQRGKSQ